MIRIIIADDHELIREGIKKIIRSSRDMRVVGEAGDVDGFLTLATQHAPDIAILDIGLPGYDGLEGLAEVRLRFPDMPVLILSMHPEERFAIRALKAGAAGYITKAMAAEELIKAIRKVMSGGSYVSPRLAELLALEVRESHDAALHESLTVRELQIASLIASGKQIKQIAAELSISISSVNTYRLRIFKKMGLSSNASLIRYAVKHGLVE
ncbi:response regulator transcription factor [Noviherbaspirillum sp.]|uniref:response regulator transcription factor n=1 Tax=Noviherbaspirillum sp. TaxID=1926288 RepID=UPI002B4985F3|nr:response regulator transcription factor [Noviherbaspirillum sp.]HJV80121.1 response regulator transcription factor [Noviherbaspirillum sp.]